MPSVKRSAAIAQVRRTISAYRDRVHEVRNDTAYLPPEGARIVDEYCLNRNDEQTLVQDAIWDSSFLDMMDDGLLLEYCAVCKELDEALGLGSWSIGSVDRIVKDGKGFWETLWGALQGEFNEDPSGSEILIDMGLNFIPFVGQACDARDIAACLKKLVIERRTGEISVWVTLLLTAIGCVPYAGDVVKAGCKAILKGADDVFLAVLKRIDAENPYRGFLKFREGFSSCIKAAIEMVCKWIEEARKSKYGSKVDSVLASARENLRKSVEFMRERIDEIGERLFKRDRIIIETSGTKRNWNKILNKKLEPNKIYKVDGYSYFTDNSGRVTKVRGELKLETKDRNVYQQGKAVEIKDGIAGEDQGGHIIARIFNGPGEQINYVPQSAKLNNGEWRDMERTWQNALSEGKRVDINIKIVYDKIGDSKRPVNFVVDYKINGKHFAKYFANN